MKVIVDTSIFVDFFRGKKNSTLENLILNNDVLLSSYVRLELLQGVRQKDRRIFDFVLGGLIPLSTSPNIFQKAEEFLIHTKESGLIMGIVDLLIATESNIENVPIYSTDKIFEKLENLNVVTVFRGFSVIG